MKRSEHLSSQKSASNATFIQMSLEI